MVTAWINALIERYDLPNSVVDRVRAAVTEYPSDLSAAHAVATTRLTDALAADKKFASPGVAAKAATAAGAAAIAVADAYGFPYILCSECPSLTERRSNATTRRAAIAHGLATSPEGSKEYAVWNNRRRVWNNFAYYPLAVEESFLEKDIYPYVTYIRDYDSPICPCCCFIRRDPTPKPLLPFTYGGGGSFQYVRECSSNEWTAASYGFLSFHPMSYVVGPALHCSTCRFIVPVVDGEVRLPPEMMYRILGIDLQMGEIRSNDVTAAAFREDTRLAHEFYD
jgi:hypothetical protein